MSGVDVDQPTISPEKLPVISVVTPSFNQAKHLESAILSVLRQGYPKLDYSVIDGGSTDGSTNIIRKHASELSMWRSERDRGHAHALNKGFEHCKGEILCWLNSDDQLAPSSLSIVAQLFTLFPQMEWLSGLPTVWDSLGRPVQTVVRRRNRFDHLRGRYGIQQESCFWRRSLWERTGGYIEESCGMMIDSELWMRFFQHAELWHVDTVLAGYRWHGLNRAVLQESKAHAETARAFQGLRALCSEAENHLLASVSSYEQKCNRHSAYSRLSTMVQAHFLKSRLPEYAYYVIRWDRGTWNVSREPYSL